MDDHDIPDRGVNPHNGKPYATSKGVFAGWNTIFRSGEKDPYMTRIWFGRLRLHIFHRGDNDPDPHDHPWDFYTFPLTGYVEEVTERSNRERFSETVDEEPFTYRQVVPAFRISFRPAEHTHRVLGPWDGRRSIFEPKPRLTTYKEGKVVTLVWKGPDRRDWGFWKTRLGKTCWVFWKEYIAGGGKEGPCQ